MKTFGSNSDSVAVAAVPPTDAECRALVQRIVSSRHFARAHQLRDILLYLAERALGDSPAGVHEHEIACTVLGRKADFNPHEDNIVRVQVSHVRKRLDDYFGAEGAHESVRILIPKGGYTLLFEARPAPLPPTPPEPIKTGRLFSTAAIIGIGLLIALGAVGFYLGLRKTAARTAFPARISGAHIGPDDLLWTRMFAGSTTSIVVADTCLVMLQDILDSDVPLSEYLNGRFPGNLLDKVPNQSLQKALRLISTRQYTSLADLNSTGRLAELSHRYSNYPPPTRYARHMNVRDFKTGNFILLGSRRGIPWVQLFEPQLNFSMEQDARTRGYYFRNKTPRTGEPDAWYQEAKTDTTVETYADVALVPNLTNTGYVLILSGIGMEASEAAGEFIAGPELQKALLAMLPKSAGKAQFRFFELLLRIRAVAGAARSSQVVTSRVFNSPLPGL
jgi:hypothetical protein